MAELGCTRLRTSWLCGTCDPRKHPIVCWPTTSAPCNASTQDVVAYSGAQA